MFHDALVPFAERRIISMIDCIQENGDISKTILYNGIQKNNLEEAMETNHTEEILLGAFNEDSCRMRSKNVAENMNLIRHIALNLLKQEKSVKMGLKSKRKKCGWDKEYLYLVLSKLNTHKVSGGAPCKGLK